MSDIKRFVDKVGEILHIAGDPEAEWFNFLPVSIAFLYEKEITISIRYQGGYDNYVMDIRGEDGKSIVFSINKDLELAARDILIQVAALDTEVREKILPLFTYKWITVNKEI